MRLAALALSILSFAFLKAEESGTPFEKLNQDQAIIAEILPLKGSDLIRITGNYKHGLATGVVCIVGETNREKGQVIIVHTEEDTAYALITEFSGNGDFSRGDRVRPKRSITF